MASANEVRVSYIGDIRDLTDKLKSVTGITASEVRAQVAAVVAGQKAQVAAITASSRAAGDAIKKVGDTSTLSGTRALKAFGPLGGVLAQASPQAGHLASGIAAITSSMEGFGAAGAAEVIGGLGISLGAAAAAAGPVVVVVGLLAAAYYDYQQQLAATVKQQGLLTDGHAAEVKWVERQNKAAVELLDTTGRLTERMRASISNAEIDKQVRADTLPLLQQRADLERKIAEAVSDGTAVRTAAGADDHAGSRKAVEDLTQQIDKIRERAGAIKSDTTAAAEYRDETVKSNAVLAQRAKDEAAAARARAKADAAAAAAQAQMLDRIGQITAAEATLAGITQASSRAHLGAVELENAAYNDKLQKIAAANIAAKNAGDQSQTITDNTLNAIQAVTAEHEANLTAITQAEIDKRVQAEIDAAAKVAEARQASFDTAIGNINQVSGYAQQALGMLDAAATDSYEHSSAIAQSLTEQLVAGDAYYTEAQKVQMQARIAASRDAARKQFAAAKAAKIAEAIASTALAAINAIAQSPPPSPFGLIGAGIATAAGGVAVGKISAQQPSFHKGYAPDETDNPRLLRKESILTPGGTSALGGPRAVRDLNAGISPGAPSGNVTILRHQVMRPYIRDFMGQPNAIKDYVNQGKVLGHRTNRRGTSG